MTYPDYTIQANAIEIPSTVDMMVSWLKTISTVTDICGQRISTSMPIEGTDVTFPWLTVGRVVGVAALPEAAIDRARIQFNAWGGHKPNGSPNWAPADALIRAVEMVIRSTYKARITPASTDQGEIMSTSLLEGIQQLQDPEDGGARFWMDAIVVTRKV